MFVDSICGNLLVGCGLLFIDVWAWCLGVALVGFLWCAVCCVNSGVSAMLRNTCLCSLWFC